MKEEIKVTKPIVGTRTQVMQAVRGLLVLGAAQITIEVKEKDTYLVTTTRQGPDGKKS